MDHPAVGDTPMAVLASESNSLRSFLCFLPFSPRIVCDSMGCIPEVLDLALQVLNALLHLVDLGASFLLLVIVYD